MPEKKTRFISLMGSMASGKTTIARLLSVEFNWHLIEENFGQNAFLARFYGDMKRWAFHSQTFYLAEKIAQTETVRLLLKKISVVQDTPVVQDVYSYAKAQRVLGHMDGDEWRLYHKIYGSFAPHLPAPDLIVYLDASIESVRSRIRKRGRQYEQSIPWEYLSLLDTLNAKWLSENTRIPLCRIPTEKNNIIQSRHARHRVIGIVRKALDTLS